jgi:quercetin dioxygenase-like cupin family protein
VKYTLLRSDQAFWRPSNQMRVENTDLAKQLEVEQVGARLWRLKPGQASTFHRHKSQEEIYILLEGTGRIRIGDETLTLNRLDSLRVAPDELRQVFNDTDADALWLVFGAPVEAANTLEMSEELLTWMYPEGPKALPPELGGGQFDG